ncbi:hemicentin-1-like protein [Dinothrombium tinctorium]|uniref:Hemicentin-1-like protein n=1 Tax=Dinothrombium tinctorium TaxID=1965070 RepID=A0A3S3SAV7_9ACAR|nr:hemicentin-1-like protein [Dinothrombium tinctorium]
MPTLQPLIEGSRFNLFCSPSRGSQPLTFEWFKNGKLLRSGEGRIEIEITKSFSSLLIERVKRDDEGNYTCSLTNNFGKDTSTVFLPIKVAVKWISEPQDVSAANGENVKITCLADGYPPPTVQWFKGGSIISNKPELNFPSIRSTDVGAYDCLVSNGEDSFLRKTIRITVSNSPSVLRQLQVATLTEGSKFTALCSVTKGSEPLYFEWFKDQSPIKASSEVKIESASPSVSILMIDKISKRDSGNYTCKVRNAFGSDNYSFQLVVKVALKWIKEPNDLKTIAGSDVEIGCIADGFPLPTTKWFKKGVEKLITSDGKLEFTAISLKDSGEYECIVENGMDPKLQKVIRIIVSVPPKLIPFPFMEPFEQGSSFRFLCTTQKGSSPIHFRWLKNDKQLLKSDNILIEDTGKDSLIHIKQLKQEDTANYTCIASNSFGEDKQTLLLLVKSPLKWLIEPVNTFARVGEDVVLQCKASGAPRPIITWTKNGGRLISNEGTLELKMVNTKDIGNYECNADNGGDVSLRKIVSLFISDLQPPKILPFINVLPLAEGSKFAAMCSVSQGSEPLSFTWMKDDRSLTNAFYNIKIDTSSIVSNLIFNSISRQDAGNYTCIVSNAAGKDSKQFYLPVVVPLKWIQEPEDATIVLGKGTSLTCAADGIPKPIIKWIHVKSGKIISLSSILSMKEIKNEEAGEYQCVAENTASTLSKIVKIDVVVPPHIIPTQNLKSVNEGRSLRIFCGVDEGEKPLMFEWFKNGLRITSGFEIIIEKNKDDSSLRIESVKRSDNGNYTCTVSNPFGHQSQTFTVTVKAPLKWTKEPKNVFLKVKESTTLECEAEGMPLPSYMWKMNGAILTTNNGILKLNDVSKSDSGIYECIADNGVDSPLQKSVDVHINDPPKVIPLATLPISEGSRFRTICGVLQGSEPLQFEWFKDGISISSINNKNILIDTTSSISTLTINNVELRHNGNYTCIVRNHLGSDSTSVNLTIKIPLKWSSEPYDVLAGSIPEGSRFSTFCTLMSGSKPVSFTWLKNGKNIKENLINIESFEQHSMISIEKVKAENAGNYTCIARNTFGSDKYTISLSIKVPMKFIKEPENIKAKANDQVIVYCEIDGNPKPNIIWNRLKPQNAMVSSESRLIFNKIDIKDAGSYECKGDNGVDNVLQKIIDIIVFESDPIESGAIVIIYVKMFENQKPKMSSFNAILSLFIFVINNINKIDMKDAPVIAPMAITRFFNESSDSIIACTVEKGSQPLNFQWLKNGTPLSLISTPNINTMNHGIVSLLTINRIRAENQGNYTCLVKNDFGSDNITIAVHVKITPKWIVEPSDVIVSKDSELSLLCDAVASPFPIFHWKKIDSREFKVKSKVLKLNNIKESDSGKYECVVSTKDGDVLRKTITVTVSVPAKFDEKHATTHAKRGESVRLSCNAIGDKPLSITWKKDTTILNKEKGENFEIINHITEQGINSELMIKNAQREDNGKYRCLAKNEYGSDERTVKLIVTEVPGPPLNVKVKETWSRSANVFWSPPFNGNNPITKYTIQYWTHHSSTRKLHEVVVTSAHTAALIKDLKPGHSYELTVVAENKVGRGEPAESVSFTTNPEEPSGAPIDVTVKAKGPTTVKVSWKAPPKDQWNGDLEGYYVGYKAYGSQQSFSFRSIPANANSDLSHKYEFFLSNLLKATTYEIVVKAFNAAGSGPLSQEVQVKTLYGDLPSAARLSIISTSRNSISFSWIHHEAQTEKSSIIGYTIHFKRQNDEWRQIPVPMVSNNIQNAKSIHLGDNTNSYTLDGLDTGARYSIYVTATNKHGTGDPSNIIDVTTQGETRIVPASFIDLAPYYLQPLFIIPIIVAIVIISIVLLVTCIWVRRIKPPIIPNDGLNTLSTKQFAYGTGTTQRYVDFDNSSKPLMCESGNTYPFPYSTMSKTNPEAQKPWERPLPTASRNNSISKEPHVYLSKEVNG